MAEVGYATLQIIPSARNFRKKLQEEIGAPLRTAGRQSGEQSGTEFGRAFTRASTRGIRATGILSGRRFMSGFGSAVTDGIGTVFSTAFKAGPILAAAAVASAALANVIGAAVTSGVLAGLGGGALAAGIALAAKSSKVRQAWRGFAQDAQKVLSGFSRPFVGPLVRAANTFGRAIRSMAPAFREAGRTLAPVIDKLAPGFAEMAKNAMPGILDAIKASVPLLTGFAEKLPEFGKGISDFFSTLAEASPSATRFVRGFMSAMARGLPAVARHLRDLTNRFFAMVDAARSIAAKIAPAFSRARDAVRGLLDSLVRGEGVGKLRDFISSLREPLTNLGNAFREIGGRLSEAWRTQLKPFLSELGSRIGPLFSEWGETIRSVISDLTPIVRGIADVFGFLWDKLGIGKIVLGTIKTVFNGLVDLVTGAMRVIRGVFRLFAGIFTGDWRKMWDGIKTIGSGIWKLIVGGFQILIVGRLGSLAKGLLGRLGSWFASGFKRIGGLAAGWVKGLLNWFLSLRSRALATVSSLAGRLVSGFTSMMSRAARAVSGKLSAVVAPFKTLVTRVVSTVKNLASRFYDIARDVISGFVRGIRNGAGRIIEAIKSAITDNLPWYVKKALGIRSPSRVFMALGEHVAAGMALGIERGSRRVTRAMAALTAIPDAGSVTVGVAGGAKTPRVAPLIGSLTLQAAPGASVRDQLEEVNWALRRIQRGGVYA